MSLMDKVYSAWFFDGANNDRMQWDMYGPLGMTNSGATATGGLRSGAASFDGFNDKMETRTHFTMPKDFTLSIFFNTSQAPPAGETRGLMSFVNTDGNGYALIYLINGGNIRFNYSDASSNIASVTTTGALNNGSYHHVMCVKSGNTLNIYVDGTLNATNTGSFSNDEVMLVKRTNFGTMTGYSDYYQGLLENVYFFKEAFGSAEANLLYSSGYPYQDNGFPIIYDFMRNYYKLEGDATDVSNIANGTETNVTYGFARVGRGAIFNGSNARIVNTTNMSDVTTTRQTSMSCWFKTTQSGGDNYPRFIGWTNTAGTVDISLGFRTTNGNPFFRVRDSNGNEHTATNTSLAVNDGAWHHVVGLLNGNTVQLYVDGGLATEVTGSFTGNFDNLRMCMGAYNSSSLSEYYNGTLDEVYTSLYSIGQQGASLLWNKGQGLYYPFHCVGFVNLGTTNGFTAVPPDIVSGTDTTSYANSSWTPPTAGLLAAQLSFRTVDVTSLTGNGVTWQKVFGTPTGSAYNHIYLAKAEDAVAGATTAVSSGTAPGCIVSFFQIYNVDCFHDVKNSLVRQSTIYNAGGGSTVEIGLATDPRSMFPGDRCAAFFVTTQNREVSSWNFTGFSQFDFMTPEIFSSAFRGGNAVNGPLCFTQYGVLTLSGVAFIMMELIEFKYSGAGQGSNQPYD